MKDIILTIIATITLFIAGCSHNGNLVGVGKVFRVGAADYGLTYVNGLMVINGGRENTESVVETTDEDGFTGAPTQDAKGVRLIRYRTGPQITGYLVDLSKKSPDAVISYVGSMPNLNKAAWDTKQEAPKGDTKATTSTDKYIDYLKEKLKSIVGDKETKATITGDGEYKELYKDNSITAQAALTAELLKYADDTAKMAGTGETFRDTLVGYAGRLAQLKTKGVKEAKTITLGRATISGGKLTALMYRLREDDGTYRDEECPTCFPLED